jgi:hypothetical protein
LWPSIKQYSRSFFGVPSGGRPTLADRASNTIFQIFLQRSFQWPPISDRPRRQFLQQLLPEPIAPPPRPFSAKRTIKTGVSATNRWICAIFSPFLRFMCTTLLPKRSIRRSESKSKETTASRRICQFANVSYALPRAAMVWHSPPRVGCISHVLPRALDLLVHEFHTSTRLLAREMHTLHAAIRLLLVYYTHRAFFQPHALTGT